MNESFDKKLPSMAILAGGLATRLRPLTETVPKSMLLVAGEPFVAHQMRMLAREGFRDIVLLCGFLGEQIESFVGDGSLFGCHVRYSYDGETLRGTGGALRRALHLLNHDFMVIYGDSYCPTNYRRIYEAFSRSKQKGAMTVFHNENQWDRSNVEFRDGRILCYDKERCTPGMTYIDYGIGAFRSSVFANWEGNCAFDLSAVQMKLLAEDQLAGVEVHERFYEIGSTEGLEETSRLLLRGNNISL